MIGGSFDEAFASRIHVSIHYWDLGADGRQTIWENLFKDLESDRPEVRVEYGARSYIRADKLLQSLDWNGRQIRNGALRFVNNAKVFDNNAICHSFSNRCFAS